MLRLICGYALQSGRCLEEKQSFYDELKGEWDDLYWDDLAMCFDDLNGHIDRNIDGVHGRYGICQENLKGRMLLQFYQEEKLCL